MSLKGARAKKKSRFSLTQKKPVVHYGRFHVQSAWDIGGVKPFIFTKPWQSLILLIVVLSTVMVPSYAYYQNVYLPSFPNPVRTPYDPFTLLWNGTTTAGYSQSAGAISFNGKVNATGFRIANSALNLPALTVNTNDAIVLTILAKNATTPRMYVAISDTQSNTFTERIGVMNDANHAWDFNLAIFTTLASATGSDTISIVSAQATTYYEVAALDVSNVRGFGNTGSITIETTAAQSGTNTLTITSSAKSSAIVELLMSTALGGAGCAMTVNLLSSQTARDVNCTGNSNGQTASATNLLGSSPLSINWSNGASNCDGANGCMNAQVGLELLQGSPVLCPDGYNCLFSQLNGSNQVQLNAKPSTPTTLDSFHSFNQMAKVGNDSLSGTFGGVNTARGFTNPNPGDTFTISGSWQISSVTILVNDTGPMVGKIGLAIFAISGSAGTTGIATGNPLAISTTFLDVSTLTTSTASQFSFTFQSGVVLAPGSYSYVLSSNSTTTPGAQILTGNPTFQYGFQNGHGVSVDGIHNLFTPGPHFDRVGWFTIQGQASSAVAMTSSPIDVSTSASKELLFYETWHNTTDIIQGQPWGWYLTTNSTLPTQANYNPLNDPSVALADVLYPESGATKNYYSYQAKTPGQLLLSASGTGTDPYPSCPQTSTLYECNSGTAQYSSKFQGISNTLNYTGNAGDNKTYTLFCVDGTPGPGSPTVNSYCSGVTQTPTLSPCTGTSQEICASNVLPFLNINGGPFYLGFWSSAGQTGSIVFGTGNTGTADARANSVWYWVPNPTTNTPAVTSPLGYLGFLGHVIGGAFNYVGNTVGGIFGPALNIAGSALSSIGSAMIQAFGVVAQGYILLLNAFGNLVGLGPIGTDLANFFIGAGAVLSEGISELITGLGWIVTLLARSANVVSILASASGNIFTLALNGLTGATNAITIILTLLYWAFLGVSLLFTTLEILLFFLLVGDYGGQGFHAWFETSKWFIFGTGLKFMVLIFNFGLDVISAIISILPKPIIQMSGIAHWPRLPIWDVTGSPTLPTGSMEAARDGNLFTIFGWIIGAIFTFSYESTTLPGSIAGFVPGAASEVSPIAMSVNIGYIVLFLSGAMLLFLLPAQLANAFPILDNNVPGRGFKISARSPQVSVGSVGVSRRSAEKGRLGRFAERRIEARRTGAERKMEDARRAAEQARQAQEQRQREQQQALQRQVQERLLREQRQREAITVRQAGGG